MATAVVRMRITAARFTPVRFTAMWIYLVRSAVMGIAAFVTVCVMTVRGPLIRMMAVVGIVSSMMAVARADMNIMVRRDNDRGWCVVIMMTAAVRTSAKNVERNPGLSLGGRKGCTNDCQGDKN